MSTKMRNKTEAAPGDVSGGVHAGSGNVFADLGLDGPEELMGKAELANRICQLIRSAGLTQGQAARRLNVDQPKISALVHGRLEGFSTDRLLRFITGLGRDVVISIRPPQVKNRAAVRVVVEA